jgi:uncharacterized protein involved in exopolysaccharide biosynthesis
MKNLSIEWMIKQIYKYKLLFLVGLFAGTSTTLIVYKILPKKYKTIGKINVSPKYFQNPMMMDFLPTVYDANELKAEREAAISGALSKDFLLSILNHENPKAAGLTPLERDNQLEKLKNSFEIFRESTTVFQIAAVSSSPEKSYELCSALMSEIVVKARSARTKYLEQLRDAVRARLQSLSGAEITSTSINEIKQQIIILEKQKSEMLVNYNANHPDIQAISAKIAGLKKMQTGTDTNQNRVFNSHSIDPTQKANSDIKARLEEDLMKKYQNLEIVLDLENKENNMYVNVIVTPLRSSNPISPQLTIFTVFGLMIGLFVAIAIVGFKSREEMLSEIQKDFFQIDPLSGKMKDRRNSKNDNKDYISIDQ